MQTINFLLDNNVTELQDLRVNGNNVMLVSNEFLIEAQKLLNLNSPGNIWAIMTEVHVTAEKLAYKLSLVDWQLFMPVSSEEVLERLATDSTW